MVTNAAKVLSIVLFLLLIQGCRITQVVPVGGAIESRTGNYDCATGQTCVITVNGTVFADTFTARPDPGYRFVGWKEKTLCGGSRSPCALEGVPVKLTAMNVNTNLQPIFEELKLLDLLPASTRGIFQVYPGASGAIDTSVTGNTWSPGPLQILQKYSAGMDIAGTAERVVLAQLSDAQDQFILLAKLDSSDVDSLLATITKTDAGVYQGYQRWAITGTDLHLARIDSLTLAMGREGALQTALDVPSGVEAAIGLGPLGGYLAGLSTAQPNSVVYGLPALYGAVAAPGNGSASLSQARVVSASFGVNADTLSGSMVFFSSNAKTFTDKLKQELAGVAGAIVPIANYGTIAAVNLDGLSVEDDMRPLLKTLFLDMDNIDYAAAVTHGGNPPVLNFKVGEAPNSIFINFEFKSLLARKYFEAAHLPTGFTLAPIRIVENETRRYFLVLNMYQSGGGLVSGARAEWSVFVNDPVTGEPRFLVVEAVADEISADSVNLLTFPEAVTHTLEGGVIASNVGDIDLGTGKGEFFSSAINWPQVPETRTRTDREFVASNDYIFWGNGVADRGLYNSSVFNRELVLVDKVSQFSFTDNSYWSNWVNPEPVHVLVYRNPLEIVVSPWWNLSETYLDSILDDPAADPTRTELITFKNGFYPGLMKGNAKDAIRGAGAALIATTITDSVPSAQYHFPLYDASSLLADVAEPGVVYTPVAVELFDGEAAGNYLTLSIYHRERDPCGTRAEWTTYVVGADGHAETLRLDVFAAEPCLDPVSLITTATNITQSHNLVTNTLHTQISSPFVNFEGSIDLDLTDDAQAGLKWLESVDRSCSLNDICDEFFIDGQLLIEDAKRAGAGIVQIDMETPWDTYIDISAVRAGVRLTPARQAMNPWRNLRSFAADAAFP